MTKYSQELYTFYVMNILDTPAKAQLLIKKQQCRSQLISDAPWGRQQTTRGKLQQFSLQLRNLWNLLVGIRPLTPLVRWAISVSVPWSLKRGIISRVILSETELDSYMKGGITYNSLQSIHNCQYVASSLDDLLLSNSNVEVRRLGK